MKLFKKLAFPLVLLMTITFTSCSTDDVEDSLKDIVDDIVPSEELLVAKWALVAKVVDGKDVAVDDCDANTILVLTSTTIVYTSYDGENCDVPDVATGVYTVDGDKINYTVETPEGSETGSFTFEVSLTELRLTGEYGTEVFEKETQL